MIGLLAALATIFGVYITWQARRDSAKAKALADALDLRMHPFELRLNTLETNAIHLDVNMEAVVTRALQPLVSQISDLDSKMDILWELQRQAAIDAAHILHHPEPERYELDHLLDAFTNNTLTPDETIQFKKYLTTIRSWEPGQDVGFPVYLGEQMAAAAILRAMTFMSPDNTSKESNTDD